ncbi:hypothetical protein LQZ21_07525 [Treponema sp. TIM-1]|uniref:hypothetical protein n=1 Tax=Treponema sp. TIM-1 TaxID=2898417 RepID=UPI00397FF50F
MDEKKYRNDFLGSLHETAAGLYKIGVISDADMREYDRNCLAGEDKTTPGIVRSQGSAPAYADQR